VATTADEARWVTPQWTLPMYSPTTGMDHLGLASVSQDRILKALSPGINVLTIHPRYWSIYLWLLTEFWDREDLPKTRVAWGRFLKPRERIIVAAILSCPEHGADIPEVAGKLRLRRELAEHPAVVDPQAHYLKNPRGGYPIYASAIAQLGLSIQEGDAPDIKTDAPTPEGREIGHALRDWLKPTRYYRTHFTDDQTPVPMKVITELAERICLCRLEAGPDHPLLQDAFLHAGDPAEAAARRASLRLVCDLWSAAQDEPIAAWDFRDLVYFRRDTHGRNYAPGNDELADTARRWRLYQQREFAAWTFNRWLRHLSLWGLAAGGDRTLLPLEQVLSTVDRADFNSQAADLGVDDPGLTADSPAQDLFDWLQTAAKAKRDLDARWDIDAPLSEEALAGFLWDLDRTGDDVTAALLCLLVLCGIRLWAKGYPLQHAHDWSLVRAGGNRRLSSDRLITDLRTHLAAGSTISELGRWFAEHYVIRQHHRVALGKLPDDTFRLRLEAGRIRFVSESVAVEMNDSRFRALSTVGLELGWLREPTPGRAPLSPTGTRLLKNGDLPALPGRDSA
jgi:hypothetical protein